MGVASEIVDLVKLIAKWVREKVPEEEIAERLAHPGSVGADMLEKAAERKQAGQDYLGRDRD